MKIVNIDKESLQVLQELRKFKEFFRKDMAFNNIKSHKKPGFYPLSRRYIFGKTAEIEVKLIPHLYTHVVIICHLMKEKFGITERQILVIG